MDSMHTLHCLAAIGLLEEAAASSPWLQAAIWQALWPVLQAMGALMLPGPAQQMPSMPGCIAW